MHNIKNVELNIKTAIFFYYRLISLAKSGILLHSSLILFIFSWTEVAEIVKSCMFVEIPRLQIFEVQIQSLLRLALSTVYYIQDSVYIYAFRPGPGQWAWQQGWQRVILLLLSILEIK